MRVLHRCYYISLFLLTCAADVICDIVCLFFRMLFKILIAPQKVVEMDTGNIVNTDVFVWVIEDKHYIQLKWLVVLVFLLISFTFKFTLPLTISKFITKIALKFILEEKTVQNGIILTVIETIWNTDSNVMKSFQTNIFTTNHFHLLFWSANNLFNRKFCLEIHFSSNNSKIKINLCSWMWYFLEYKCLSFFYNLICNYESYYMYKERNKSEINCINCSFIAEQILAVLFKLSIR